MDTNDVIEDLAALLRVGGLQSVQVERELAAIQQAVDIAESRIKDVMTGGAATAFKRCLPLLAETMDTLQKDMVRQVVTDEKLRCLAVTADELTALLFGEFVHLTADEVNGVYRMRRTSFYTRMGRAIEQQAYYNAIEAVAKDHGKSAVGVLNRIMREEGVSKLKLRRAMKRFGGQFAAPLDEDQLIRLGELVVNAALPTFEGLITERKYEAGGHMVYFLCVAPEVRAELEDLYMQTVADHTPLGFMVCEPKPIESGLLNIRHRYLTEPHQLPADNIKAGGTAIEAANQIQRVPYGINKEVLAVINSLTAEQFDMVLKTAGSSKDVAAKRRASTKVVEAAMDAAQFDRIWFPSFFDFRGRIYTAASSGLGPQGSDIAKGLLTLAACDVPLGQDGLWYLYHELGNVWGYDKELLDNKIEKAKALPIAEVAANPLANLQWLEADEPVKALAIMLDIQAALDSGNPETYISKQVVAFDGSCNGMQHLSLLTRDLEGAQATNVVGDARQRNDLYAVIGSKVEELLEDLHSPEAEHLKCLADKGQDLGNDKKAPGMRKIVKRAVMTIPYGATDAGLIDQFLDDDHGFETRAEATLMRDLLLQAMEGAAPKAMEVRQWLRKCARKLGGAGLAPEWTTVAGSHVSSRYMHYGMRQIRLNDGNKVNMSDPAKPTKVRIEKSVQGIVANLIHSFDAAALQKTVVASVAEGLNHFSFIHDSFGCSPGQGALLNRVLREQILEMYGPDVLGHLADELHALAASKGAELPEPPECGTLEVADILTSPYFFA